MKTQILQFKDLAEWQGCVLAMAISALFIQGIFATYAMHAT